MRERLIAAVNALQDGQVVAVATDTVYGFVADPHNKEAVEEIFKLKGRESNKLLQLLVGDPASAQEYIKLPDSTMPLQKYWPGGLTIVGRRLKTTAPGVGDEPTLGVRVPVGHTIKQLLDLFGGPLAATSANKSGAKPARTAKELENILAGEDILILAADQDVIEREASTVVDVTSFPFKVLRQGSEKIPNELLLN